MVLAVPFVLAPLVAMCIGVLAYSNLNRQYSQEFAASQEKQRKLDELTTENGKIREGVMEMLNDHLPGLMTFKFDQSVDMNNKYLKALAFYESDSAESVIGGYQVRATFFNQSATKVFPEVKISFFDRDGFVIGYYHISPTSGSNAALPPLQPNQKRSDLSAHVKLPGGVMPAYFIVDVD